MLFIVLVGFTLTPARAATSDPDSIDSVEQQILQTTKRLQKLDAEIAESQQQKESLQAAIAAAESRVGERKQRIQGLDDEISRYETRLITLEQLVNEEQTLVTQRKQQLSDSLNQSQRLGQDIGLKVLLQHNDPALAARLGVYTDYMLRAQQQHILQQVTALQRVEKAQATALKDRNWLNYIKRKASTQHDSYLAEQTSTSQSLNDVDTRLGNKTRTVSELKTDHLRLQSLMEELKAAEAARSGYFLSGKGDYSLPVNGQIKARYGDVKSVGRLRWNGLFISSESGRAVRAVADGEVVYSAWLQGFGMLVIVDHGDAFMTLYGGNRDVTHKKGTWVESGATIATVGDSGGQTTSGVYFEIRHNAKPVDPAEWISESNRGHLKSAKR
ncbi:MAG: peptidoglycan DD-metalloendopeptidase family protein [Granulosicoccus sp.]